MEFTKEQLSAKEKAVNDLKKLYQKSKDHAYKIFIRCAWETINEFQEM